MFEGPLYDPAAVEALFLMCGVLMFVAGVIGVAIGSLLL